MEGILPKLIEEYSQAMQEHLTANVETWPSAVELGQRALAASLGAADIATIHQQALERILENSPNLPACIETVKLASRFLIQTLLPFEEKYQEKSGKPIFFAGKAGETLKAGEEKELVDKNRMHSKSEKADFSPSAAAKKCLEIGRSLERGRCDRALLEKTEIALKQANRRWEFHLENSPIAIIEWNLSSGVLRWSPQAEKIFGWRAEEVIGKEFTDFRLIHKEDLLAVEEIIAGLADGSIERNVCQNRNYTKKGKILEVQWYNSVLLDDDGDVVSILSLAQDITTQKLAERQRDRLVQELKRRKQTLEEQVAARTAELATELARRQQTEAILKDLIEGTAAVTGDDFFPALVQHLASALEVRTVSVSEVRAETLHTLAFCSNRQLLPNVSYKIAGSPCEITLVRGKYFCPMGAQSKFPEDIDLATLEVESYLGVSLLDREGKAIGNLCILHDRPLIESDRYFGILQIFAARAGAELERKRATEALQLIRFSLDRVKDAVFLSNSDAQFLYVNEAATRVLGYSKKQLLAMKVYDINPNYPKATWSDFWHELKQQGTITIESVHLAKNGREIPVEISANYLLFNGQEYDCAIARDITERLSAEAALRQTQAMFQSMAANVPGMLYQFLRSADGGYAFIYASSNCREVFEIDRETIVEDAKAVFDSIHPEDLPWFWESIEISATTLLEWRWEGKIITPSGCLKWIQGISRPQRQPNGDVIWDGIVVDVSDRKQAEAELYESRQLLRLVMDNIPQAIFWKDRYSIYLGCNRRFAEIAGVGKPENIAGKNDYDLPWRRSEADFFRQCDARVMKNDAPEYHFIEPQRQADGKNNWLDTSKIPLHDSKGNVVGILGSFEDITERLRAEEALRKSEEKFRHLVETLNDWVWEIDENFVYTYASPKVLDLLGYHPQELQGLTPFDLMPPTQAEPIAAFRELLADRAAFNRFEVVFRRIDFLQRVENPTNETERERVQVLQKNVFGSGRVILETSGVPIFGDRGNFLGYRGVARDITGSKRAREALRESEEKFRQLAENIDSVFWMTDLEGTRFIYVSSAYEKIWGRSRKSVYASLQSWIDAIHPEDRQVAIATRKKFLSAGYDREYRIIRPTSGGSVSGISPVDASKEGGEIRWIRDRAFPVKNDRGEVFRFAGIAEDITKRKQAEEALRSSQHFIQRIADASPNILYIYDLIEQQNFYVNHQILPILGYTPPEVQAMGAEFLASIMHLDDLELLPGHFAQFDTAKDGEIFTFEYRVKHRNGEWRWVYSRDTVFSRNSEGKVQQILGTATDISDRKQAEAKIQASLKQKELLLKEIHHRVKNNLQIVSSLLWLQANSIEDPKVVRLFEDSQNRIYSMALVHQKLCGSDDLSRINLGEYLEDLIYYLFESYNIAQEQIELKINVEPIFLNIETVIPCGTIVTELVSNIFKYAFPNCLQEPDREDTFSPIDNCINAVTVVECYLRPEDQKIILTVKDNGIGLPESIDVSKTKSLGLQLVSDLSKQLKATMELDRSNGTQFRLIFSELYYPDRF